MRWLTICVILIFITKVGHAQFSETDFTPGNIIDSVYCVGYPEQSYSLYLPERYHSDIKWPIVFIFDPAARGTLGTAVFKLAAERFGCILLCSNNSSNQSLEGSYHAAEIMFKDAFHRFSIDTCRVYVAGFSGGSRFASNLAIQNRQIKGVVGCGAGMVLNKTTIPCFRETFLYYGIVGRRDLNLQDMIQTKERLIKLNIRSHIQFIDGRHYWPPEEQIAVAVAWLNFMTDSSNIDSRDYYIDAQMKEVDQMVGNDRLLDAVVRLESLTNEFPALNKSDRSTELKKNRIYRKQIKQRSRAYNQEFKKQKQYLDVLTTFEYSTPLRPDTIHTAQWWKTEISMLKGWEGSKNMEISYTASRLMYMLEVHFSEAIDSYVNKSQLDKAAFLADVWLNITPDQLWTLWNTVRVYALKSDKKKTIEIIKKVVSSGEANAKWFDQAEEFDFLRSDPDFLSLIRLLDE